MFATCGPKNASAVSLSPKIIAERNRGLRFYAADVLPMTLPVENTGAFQEK